jgi:hypothetical protein
VSATVVDGQDLDIPVVAAAVDFLVFDPQIRKMDPLVEVRQVVLVSPLLDLAAIAVGMAVVVITVAIALVEPRLVLTLELVVEDDAIDPRAALFQALGFTFERPIDLDVVFEFSLAFNARVEGLAAFPIAVTMALEQAAALLRERHGVVARAGYTGRLDQPLLTEMTKVARSRIGRTIVVVSEITTGDHSKRADGRQRSRLRATQGVLTITIAHHLALASSRQTQISHEDVTRISIRRIGVPIRRSFRLTITFVAFQILDARVRAAAKLWTAIVVTIAVAPMSVSRAVAFTRVTTPAWIVKHARLQRAHPDGYAGRHAPHRERREALEWLYPRPRGRWREHERD